MILTLGVYSLEVTIAAHRLISYALGVVVDHDDGVAYMEFAVDVASVEFGLTAATTHCLDFLEMIGELYQATSAVK